MLSLILLVFSRTAVAAPVITRAPSDVIALLGQNATFTVSATGAGPLSYRWERNGFPIAGAISDTLVLPRVSPTDADAYGVVVSDATGSIRSTLARLWVPPASYPTHVAVDDRFDPSLETENNALIKAVVPSPDGGFYAAGRLTSVNGLARSHVVRIKADRAVDTGFIPAVVEGQEVTALALQPDRKVVLAGNFISVGSARRHAVARLNADGSVDASFDATPWLGSGSWAMAVVVGVDGGIIVSAANGPGALLKLRPDGSLDRVLIPNGGLVNAVLVQPDGRVLAAGHFTVWDQGTYWQNLVRFNADGTVDRSLSSTSFGGTPICLALAPDESILVGGVDGGLVRLSRVGVRDSTFAPMVAGPSGSWQVRAVAAQADGRLVIGGFFTSVNGSERSNVARLNADGTVDAFSPWSASWVVHAVHPRTDGSVVVGSESTGTYALRHYSASGEAISPAWTMRSRAGPNGAIALPTGKFLLFGSFDLAGDLPAPGGIVRLNADATLDRTFRPPAITELATASVRTAVALPDGRLAVGGTGNAFGSSQRAGIVLLKSDGSTDSTFTPPMGRLTHASLIEYLPSRKFFVVGSTYSPGRTWQRDIAVFNLDGSIDTSFVPGTGFDDEPRCALALPDGRVLVGGFFTTYQGVPCTYIARLNADGSLDPTFSANARFSQGVTALASAPGGKIVAAGGWLTPDAKFRRIVRLNSDGTPDTSFNASDSAFPAGLLVQPDSKVIYRDANDALMRLNADGSLDPTFRGRDFRSPQTTAGATLLMRENGQLIVVDRGGNFGKFYATASAGAPELTAVPEPQIVARNGMATLNVGATSLRPMTYQWFHDGVAIAGATGASLTLTNFVPGKEGAYTVAVTNEFGTTMSPPAIISAPPNTAGRLTNLSIRAVAGSGSDALIVGFAIGGSGTGGYKALVLRGIGPALSAFGLSSVLPDPTLTLYDAANQIVDNNDNWSGVFEFGTLGAFPLPGSPPKDAAIYNPYATAGAGSIVITDRGGASGIALGEVYDATPANASTVFTPRLVNVSARAMVGSADDVLILGFGIGGQTGARVLVRAVGPTLTQVPFSLAGALSDPVLEIYDHRQALLASNDDWGGGGTTAELTSAFGKVGAFPLTSPTSKDAAAVILLPPGTYSVIVRGKGGATGIAVVELYEVP